jgi:alpha-L-fucosidase
MNRRTVPAARRIRATSLLACALVAASPSSSGAEPPVIDAAALPALVAANRAALGAPAADPARHRLQILLSLVDDRGEVPRLLRFGFRVDQEYFYPASAIGTAAAAAALATIRDLAEDRAAIDPDTPLAFHHLEERPDGEVAAGVTTSVARAIEDSLVGADDAAFDRLYEFVGHREIHELLFAAGLDSIRIHHRLGVALSEEMNRCSPRIDVLLGDGEPLVLPSRRSDRILGANEIAGIAVGEECVVAGERVAIPLSFARRNRISLVDLQDLHLMILRPDIDLGKPGLALDAEDRELLARAMSSFGHEAADGRADHARFLLPGLLEVAPADDWIVHHANGLAHGFTVENAAVTHRRSGRSFFLTAALYTNSDGVMNDDVYDYDDIAFPFWKALGATVARAVLGGSIETAASPARVALPEPLPPLPSPRQLAWHDREYYAFVHFNMNTFTGEEWGKGDEDPDLFAPTDLDCRQWAQVAKDAGMTGIILTAKHHDGFCLWPSNVTSHSVKSSAWRDGQGDVLADLSRACRELGLGFGVYLSPWDRNAESYGDSPRYDAFYVAQLEEVLSGYGEVFEVWFDGACGEGKDGKRQVYDWPRYVAAVRAHQPHAVIFSDAGPDVRWVGNEDGFAGETCYAMLRRDEFFPGTPNYRELTSGHLDGTHWVPAECDVSIRPGWYYHADQDDDVKSVDRLLEIWYGSVGRGACLLLNLPVDRRGRVHEADATRLIEFRTARDALFEHDLARAAIARAPHQRGGPLDPRFAPNLAIDGDPATYFAVDDAALQAILEIDLGATRDVDHVVLEEPIALGQRVLEFRIEGQVDGEDGFQEIARGTTIGRKRIVRFEPHAVRTLRIVIADSRSCPLISGVEVYASAR